MPSVLWKIPVLILISPMLVLLLLGCLIYLPFDFIKYRRSRLYRDLRTPYFLFYGIAPCVKLYEMIHQNDLPIEFVPEPDGPFGYFLFRDIVILYGFCSLLFDSKQGLWTAEIDDEWIPLERPMTDSIGRINVLKGTEICRRAIVLAEEAAFSIEEDPALIAHSPLFLIHNGKNTAAVLRAYLAKLGANLPEE